MKLSELKFKVITGSKERNELIQEALFKKGGKWQNGVGRKCSATAHLFCTSN